MTILQETMGRVLVVTIDRPAARNAVDPPTAAALYDAFRAFEADEALSVAILTGSGGAFCAGFDLRAAASGLDAAWFARHAIGPDWTNPVGDPRPGPMGPTRLALSKPVIAAIAGPAVAGGMELALWCDLRLLEENAYFGIYCRRWGVPLIDGGTVRLPRLVGQGRALDLILTGRRVDAPEAIAIGLADRLVPAGAALASARALAEDLARFPQACLRDDRRSALMPPAELARALVREWASIASFHTEGVFGATRFLSGQGRGGAPGR
ncbi:MAG TPA: crotonase/enoyl-CoA hydratase family protein [Paracoccaceae bacterium]|nr:crotonase/enoyl-CoA hydratase family protein [Paracoccaceae bacterium]